MSFIGEIIGLMTVIAFWWKWLSLHSEIGDGAGDPQSLLARGEPCSICVTSHASACFWWIHEECKASKGKSELFELDSVSCLSSKSGEACPKEMGEEGPRDSSQELDVLADV